MTTVVPLTAACVASYLIGGIPFGVIAGKLRGVDIRRVGSGNIGATNVARLLGRGWGVGVFVLDAGKGFVPTFAYGQMVGREASSTYFGSPIGDTVWLVIGLCALSGHIFSPFLRFKGGKGVATSFGAALGIYPDLTFPALCAAAVWATAVYAIRLSSAGSMAASVAFPVSYLVLGSPDGAGVTRHWPFVIFTLLVSVGVLVRHRANIARILAGTEPRMGAPCSADPPTRDC